MSRFTSDMSPDEMNATIAKAFSVTPPVELIFGETVLLGPKQLEVHLINSPEEQVAHERLYRLLRRNDVHFLYPEFIGKHHKAHVTTRPAATFAPDERHLSRGAYLIEVVDGKRIPRGRFVLGA